MIKGLNDEDRREIVKYRLEKSLRTYNEAVGSIANGYVETAANRLYYAAYYAVSALLVSFKYEASTHNGVIQMFGKAFIKSKILDRKYGTILVSEKSMIARLAISSSFLITSLWKKSKIFTKSM